ncbi:MAG: hypothetical protein MR853_06350 [Selenomonadales bacterium]|nr:hypothetical protein [Selenomonadales bacterium]
MTTEFFSVIIVIGAIIVWFARRQLIKARQEEISNNPEALKADTGRLRDELEQSADEIIDRMAKHIDRLEGLIKEADRKAKILQDRIDYLEASGGRKTDEGDDSDAAFSAILEESIYQENMRPRGEAEATADLDADTELNDESYSIDISSEADSESYSMEIPEDQLEAYIMSRKADEIPDRPVESLVDKAYDTRANSAKAQELLERGVSAEEISRKTNLGIGAVTLMQAIQQREAKKET